MSVPRAGGSPEPCSNAIAFYPATEQWNSINETKFNHLKFVAFGKKPSHLPTESDVLDAPGGVTIFLLLTESGEVKGSRCACSAMFLSLRTPRASRR